jgi:hypothetical protein
MVVTAGLKIISFEAITIAVSQQREVLPAKRCEE